MWTHPSSGQATGGRGNPGVACSRGRGSRTHVARAHLVQQGDVKLPTETTSSSDFEAQRQEAQMNVSVSASPAWEAQLGGGLNAFLPSARALKCCKKGEDMSATCWLLHLNKNDHFKTPLSWWHRPVTPAAGRLRQVDHCESKARLGYTLSSRSTWATVRHVSKPNHHFIFLLGLLPSSHMSSPFERVQCAHLLQNKALLYSFLLVFTKLLVCERGSS